MELIFIVFCIAGIMFPTMQLRAYRKIKRQMREEKEYYEANKERLWAEYHAKKADWESRGSPWWEAPIRRPDYKPFEIIQ